MRYARSIIMCITLAFLLVAQASYGTINHIVFKIVLDEEEIKNKEHDTTISGTEVLNVHKKYILSDSGIEEVMIFKSAVKPNKLMVGFRLNEQGKKQMSIIVKKFPDHRIAIFVSKTLIAVLPALPVSFSSDTIVVTWPRKERELNLIAHEINKKPASMLMLYIDETAKYNDVAANEWGKIYNKITNTLEKKHRETPKQDLDI